MQTTAGIYQLVNACLCNICGPLMGAVRSKRNEKQAKAVKQEKGILKADLSKKTIECFKNIVEEKYLF